jgi:hypothetical protein
MIVQLEGLVHSIFERPRRPRRKHVDRPGPFLLLVFTWRSWRLGAAMKSSQKKRTTKSESALPHWLVQHSISGEGSGLRGLTPWFSV